MSDRYVRLVALPPSGLIRRERDGKLLNAADYMNKIGRVIYEEDEALDTDRPTGYESVLCLVNFDHDNQIEDNSVWIPESTCEVNSEKWITFLKTVENPSFQKWWDQNKKGVCHDICYRWLLDINDPEIEAELAHIACQAWVAKEG